MTTLRKSCPLAPPVCPRVAIRPRGAHHCIDRRDGSGARRETSRAMQAHLKPGTIVMTGSVALPIISGRAGG